MAYIRSIGIAVPPYRIDQEDAKQFAKQMFQSSLNVHELQSVFDHTAIQQRYISKPKSWFLEPHGFQERNQAYIDIAISLCRQAAERCLRQAGISPEEIDHLFFVSTTGLATPSIDTYLIQQLKLNPMVKRTPIWGLGCAGGVVGLARAFEYIRAYPQAKVLLVAVELCSLTFRLQDLSKRNFVATALFADGAAAACITGEGKPCESICQPVVIDAMSYIWPDQQKMMGWRVMDDGFEVVFSRKIPEFVKQNIGKVIYPFLQQHQLSLSEIEHFLFHPGGQKVLKAYQEALDISPRQLAVSANILRDYGNMSSVSVLFMLAEFMKEQINPGSLGLMAALGPGFSAELLLCRWEKL